MIKKAVRSPDGKGLRNPLFDVIKVLTIFKVIR